MPININASANFDLNVDGVDAMNIYASLMKPNGLQNMIEKIVISANTNNNLNVSIDSANPVEDVAAISADSVDSVIDPNDYANNAIKSGNITNSWGVNTVLRKLT